MCKNVFILFINYFSLLIKHSFAKIMLVFVQHLLNYNLCLLPIEIPPY